MIGMSSFTQETIPNEWGTLAVWRMGTGIPVVAVHGLGGSGRYWRGLGELLRGKLLLAPDLAGFGWSSIPPVRFDRRFHLDNLTRVIDALVPTPQTVHLVGHSIGGLLVALWAVENPDRVRSLALVSVPMPHESLVPGLARRIARRPTDDRGFLVSHLSRLLWPTIGRIAALTGRYPADVIEDFGRQSLGARADTLWSLAGDESVVDELATLAEASQRFPVLRLQAADDRHLGPNDMARWRSLLPNADVRTVDSGGHQFLLRVSFLPLSQWLEKVQ